MNKYAIEIKWATILSLAYLIWMIIEKQFGFHSEKALQEPLFNLLFIPFLVVLFYFAIRNKKKTIFNNEMEWKQGFASGIVLTLLLTVTTTVVVMLTFNIISPDFFKTAIEQSDNKDLAQLNYNLPIFIKNNIFDKLSFGVVLAAIMSYFIKTK